MKDIRMGCVSIVVAIYNMSSWLDICIQSILSQTYDNLEIILVNDGSTDDSRNIAERYREIDQRVILLDKENCGVADARNSGVELAGGEYLAFVDPDDWIETEFFEKLVNHIEQAGADIACVGFDYGRDGSFQIPKQRMKNVRMNREQCLRRLCENKWFTSHVWNKLYRRKVFEGVRFPKGDNYEDIAVMHEVIKNADYIVCSDEILYHYCMRSESIIHVQSAKNEMDNFHAYLKRLRSVTERYLKQRVMRCCAMSSYQILYLSDNKFEEREYREVQSFWTENSSIRFLGIKYYIMYRFPEVYKRFINRQQKNIG